MKAKKKVLLVDDDKDLVISTKAFLEGKGYEVAVAYNGTEGMAQIQMGRPDLVVLDIMMDYDAEGFNMAYKLRENEKTKSLPIIIVSGFGQHLESKMQNFEFVMGRDWPAAAMIDKPVDLKKLAEKIEKVLAEGAH